MSNGECQACGAWVTFKKKERTTMRHQEQYYVGFSMFQYVYECPVCGEIHN